MDGKRGRAIQEAAAEAALSAVGSYGDVFEKHLAAAGYVVVPREPTQPMKFAGGRAMNAGSLPQADDIYRAMIGADK